MGIIQKYLTHGNRGFDKELTRGAVVNEKRNNNFSIINSLPHFTVIEKLFCFRLIEEKILMSLNFLFKIFKIVHSNNLKRDATYTRTHTIV